MKAEHVQDVNASPYMAYIAATGGGVSFIDKFLSHGGGSKTILEFLVPYHQGFQHEFLGWEPEKYVCPDTARKMANAAYRKACKVNDPLYSIGIGCTVSLATNNEREGRNHRIHIALQSADTFTGVNIVIPQGRYNRDQEERIVAEIIFKLLYEKAVGKKIEVIHGGYKALGEAQTVNINLKDKPDWVSFFTGETDLYINGPATQELLKQDRTVVFSGSFNPLHAGHMEMYQKAKEITGITPVFEISIQNVDKPELNLWDIYQRHDALVDFPLVFTRAPFFTQKAEALRANFPASKTVDGFDKRIDFVVGLDTWERFTTYRDTHTLRNHRAFHDNVGFVVFNRGGKQIDEFNHNFKHVTFIHGFDNPLSSTQLRLANNEK